MLLLRLLAISLVIVTNTWLLNPVCSDGFSPYKRAMARRADRELSSQTGEPCAAAVVWRSRRQPSSLSSSYSRSQQRPPAVSTRASGTHRFVRSAPALCTGECGVDSGYQRGHEARQGSPGARHSQKRDADKTKLDYYGSDHSAPQQGHAMPPSRVTRSLQDEEELNSSWNGAPPRSSTVSAPLHVPSTHSVNGDAQPSIGAADDENFSGEVEDEDLGASARPALHSGRSGASSWANTVPRAPPSWMTALYFRGGREQLRLRPDADLELPRAKFSLELWVKPEGGQSNPAVIAGVFDNCSHSLSEKGWSVGIQTLEPGSTKDARFYFTLRTDRAVKSTTVHSHQRYHGNAWTHLMASYNSHNMTLYVDGAKVGESSFQSGNLYSSFMKTCRTFFLGSNQSEKSHSFRGHIGGLILWDYARTQEDLMQRPQDIDKSDPLLAMWADFTNVEQLWTPYKFGLHPSVVTTPIPEQELVSPFDPPPCGLTPCDNTEIIAGYNNNWQLRTPKHVRYRIVNLADDNGGNPTVSKAQIELQHKALVEAFRPYNITLEINVHTVRNSSLREKFILSNCRIEKIGNRQCDPECDHPRTGHDGGDCLRLGPCYSWKRQDGVCNMECNSIYYDYDDGDCCEPAVTDVLKTCFDPESPDRAYMSIKELKDELQLSGTDTLNVFFANNSAREELAGAATWPWAKEALTHQGGMVLNPSYFGTVGHHNTMIHEMGHIFGLYHVFKGVSERDSCDDPCQETTPSMETGDLCADTAPTPKSKVCHDPGDVNDTCGVTNYQDTPYSNYMSYTDDNCTNHFTPNQVARMHCYLDLVYQKWLTTRQPSPVPLAPIITAQTARSVSLYWLAPLSGPLYQSSALGFSTVDCGLCESDGVFHQYAFEAASPRVCDTSGYWTPEEAVGPPDVEQPCEPSLQAWSPELSLYDTNVTSPCPDTEGCTLTLDFLHPVAPHSLTLWVTYISTSKLLLTIYHRIKRGGVIHLGPQHVYCDMPLTLRLSTNSAAVEAIRLSTFDEKLEIDAVMLSSGPDSPLCSGCKPLLYKVYRKPPFTREPPAQRQQTFTDRFVSVQTGVRYQYTVQVEAENVSDESPSLVYIHGQPYCGDGFIQGSECDDSNLLDGDGCSKKCHKETDFNCNGEPSQCYVFDGDGVCEEFERGSSVQDCGYFTPLGFNDQWASTATASHQDPHKCPARAVTGEPHLNKLCRSQHLDIGDRLPTGAWFPCTTQDDSNDLEHTYWLKVGFSHPGVAASVMVYLASDGSWSGEQCRRTVVVLLSDTTGKNHSLGSHDLSCHHNPLVVNVTHDLSRPFFLTSAVVLLLSSPSVAVAGVALRTSCHFSTFAQTGCASQGGLPHSYLPLYTRTMCTGGGEASRCSVRCHRGYSIKFLSGKGELSYQREAKLECFHGSWDRMVRCRPVDCGLPDQSHVYHAIFSCPWGTTFGKQCSFTCGSPAILQGDSDRLVCLEDGLWSFPEAYCKIECPEVPSIPNAHLLTGECLASGHDIGSVCRYKCSPGYYVMGSLKKKRPRKYFKLECLEEGQWEEAGCEPVSCPDLPDVYQGMYSCTNGLYYDSYCTLQCPDPKETSVIHCSKDGKWTSEFTMCSQLQGSCPPPAEINSVEYICDQGTAVGAVCLAACTDLCDPVVLPNGTTADSLQHWVMPTQLQSIVCTGMMKWFPDPQHIHCIQSCEPFAGDGWCDTINNRAYCQYDGGDCCPSTLSSRKVIQFGADCNQDECTCRDPDAEENKSQAKHSRGGGAN
uniref:Sushi domain-containing protein n=1 Tax=Periophthalmus magnuspinnatus TaxID=409849 RepID=A0A3B3ZES9_9GOBI